MTALYATRVFAVLALAAGACGPSRARRGLAARPAPEPAPAAIPDAAVVADMAAPPDLPASIDAPPEAAPADRPPALSPPPDAPPAPRPDVAAPQASVDTAPAVDARPAACPCTLWPATPPPARVADDMMARSGLELGVKITSDVDGRVVALRFYKADQDTGPHTASVWSADGALLATAPFTNETASGWQEVTLGTAVPVTAGKTYVASYHTSAGYYAATNDFFSASGADRPPLHAPAAGPQGGNGVFHYGTPGFPGETWRSSNYWVDVVFAP